MNELMRFDQALHADSCFAATLAATGGESLALLDADGMPLMSVRIEIDRSLSITPMVGSAWGPSVSLGVREISLGNAVGFEFAFGKEHLVLSVNKVSCFSDRLPGGPSAVRSVGAIGNWEYPCTWPLGAPVAAPVIPSNPFALQTDARSEGSYTLVLGAAPAEIVCGLEGKVVVVEPDPVCLQAAGRLLSRSRVTEAVFIHALPVLSHQPQRAAARIFANDAFRGDRRTTPTREPGWLSYTTSVTGLDVIERLFGRPSAVFTAEPAMAEMMREERPFGDAPLSTLLVPVDSEAPGWLSSAGFGCFRVMRRRTLQYAGDAVMTKHDAIPALNLEGLRALAAIRRPVDDPLLVLCGRSD